MLKHAEEPETHGRDSEAGKARESPNAMNEAADTARERFWLRGSGSCRGSKGFFKS